ncbi:DUF5694 domain-containing protein [Massilia sp. ST3]|uniref:DUF5694 domain-containing protein n=1 Tax=Massilia sp. ST3 TaxID=2824903 RepID=UPI001B83B4CE|nr:DUF5694 domain-containing protein [Massilia sp. ST3]MBQ5946228.1 hypothetical protein [Massilia sp. ST3]
MLRPFASFVGLLLTLGAQAADFEPGKLKGPKSGPQNEVLVLGTPHLSQLPPVFQPSGLGPLNERLERWRPQVIAIEALSGPQCAFLRQFPHRYRETVGDYCWDTAPARAATGLEVPAATAQAEAMLASWPQAPSPAQRRRLAALFLAGGEPASALVQWLRLPESERRSGDGLDAALAAALEKLRVKRREDYLIAAPLAARLGLERLYAFDDHTADQPMKDEAEQKRYGAALMKAWDNPAGAKRKQLDTALKAHIGTQEGVLAMYRAFNAPGQSRLVFDNDFGAALEEPSPQGYGRDYVGYWETRNLRMAANLREVVNAHRGGRTLVLVGASHKGYLDAYLDQMHDLRLADALRVLE